MNTLAHQAREVASRSLDYFASDDILDDDGIVKLIYGTPEDQAKHAVATIIALIRILPEDQQVEAFHRVCLDIWDGFRAG